jgi:hypothetical protein
MDADLSGLLEAAQYSIPAREKEPRIAAGLERLTAHHRAHCPPYARMLDAMGASGRSGGSVEAQPYLPASLFKHLTLSSVPDEEVFKVMTSSGTSGQVPSRIHLDVDTAKLQTRALSSIVTHFLGPTRRPMLIVDHPAVLRDRKRFSARTAGIVGMMNFGRDHHFLLDDDLGVDRAALARWLDAHAGQDLLIFGFTSLVWQELVRRFGDDGLDLGRATLVHAGGWKRLLDAAVTREAFREALRTTHGVTEVHDFYGMVEQVGSVFFECPAGSFHAPNFADVVVRDPTTWEPAAPGQPGVIEVVSLLPRSYPGHAILTEDRGVLHGIDDCSCGRLGRHFGVLGRVPKAEIRGCSDTLERAA